MRYWIRALVLLVAVAWIGWLNHQHWPVLAAPNVFQPGVGAVEFPDTRLTRIDVQAIADGASTQPMLPHLRVLELAIPDHELTAAFVDPGGDFTNFTRYGWPVPFLSYRRDAVFDDIYTLETPIATPGLRGNMWSNLSHATYRIDDAGVRLVRIIDLRAMSGVVVVVLLAWWLATLSGAFVRRCCLPRRWSPPGQRALRWMLPVAAVLIVAVLSFMPREEESRFPRAQAGGFPATERTGITIAQARHLATEPRGEATFAQAILDATGHGHDDERVLAIGTYRPFPMTVEHGRGGWPRGMLHRSRVQWSNSTAEPGLRIRWLRNELQVRHIGLADTPAPGLAGNTDGRVMTSWTVRAPGLAAALLLLCAAWLVGHLPWVASRMILHRRQRWRQARGECLFCGYQLP